MFNISTVCWGSRECETQINSAADWSAVLRDALWNIPGGRGKSWTQEIIKSVCSQKHSQMRLKQRTSQLSTTLIPLKVSLGEFWKVFAMRSQAGPWKTSCSATWIQNQDVLWFDRNASIFSVATFILFDVRMRNSFSHGRWKSPEFLLFLLCFTQGPGLSTHTKWENCQSAWLSSLNDGWREKKPDYYFLLSLSPGTIVDRRLNWP